MELKLVEGFKLIDGMEDFSITMSTGQTVVVENRHATKLSEISSKKYLRIFIQSLLDDCNSKTKSDFMSTLLRKKDYWKIIQYEKISQLNSLIDSVLESERLELESERKRYLSFFYSIQRIIDYAENEFDQSYLKEINNNQVPGIVKSDGKKFSLKEIAYLYFYNGEPITKDNCDTEAKKYSWYSGHKLIQHYNNAQKRLDTKGLSVQKLKNRIELLNSIIDYVKLEKQKIPKDDLRKLVTDLEDISDY